MTCCRIPSPLTQRQHSCYSSCLPVPTHCTPVPDTSSTLVLVTHYWKKTPKVRHQNQGRGCNYITLNNLNRVKFLCVRPGISSPPASPKAPAFIHVPNPAGPNSRGTSPLRRETQPSALSGFDSPKIGASVVAFFFSASNSAPEVTRLGHSAVNPVFRPVTSFAILFLNATPPKDNPVKWFDYASPQSLQEAVALLSANPGARPLAGGTDLLVQMRSGRKDTACVVDVKRVPELNEISYDPARGLTLGAVVPCYRIYANSTILRNYRSLADVAALIGGTQIQGRASIGGNLCNAAPSADSIPLLIALGARCRIAGPSGAREVAVEDFCTAPGRNVLAPGELLVSIQLPPPAPGSGARYLRFIPRNEMDIAVAGAGVHVVMDNGNFRSARIALAAVAPTPLFVREAGDSLAGRPASDASLAEAAEFARRAARPITDMRGTADYRRHLCGVLTRRALEDAITIAREAQ